MSRLRYRFCPCWRSASSCLSWADVRWSHVPYATVTALSRRGVYGVGIGAGIAVLTLLLTFREDIAWINSPAGEALPAQIQRKFSLDGSLQLLGYDLSGQTARAGETLVVNAYWHALEEIDINWSSFLHLSSGGPPHAQVDKIHPADLALTEVLEFSRIRLGKVRPADSLGPGPGQLRFDNRALHMRPDAAGRVRQWLSAAGDRRE